MSRERRLYDQFLLMLSLSQIREAGIRRYRLVSKQRLEGALLDLIRNS